ncbi:hypothetical protein BV25DRAFT_1827955 [Artomyces pyxidatus]|uniref:Uncharacterized protein n=1 Tax=Artomyces pyxidatus TaxID=48021 RepID=A0ACB8SVQ0_9AGAM|nr:hypothetical protein BV25DRAFT_1827955 [Artomyces pyxidatus]
MLSSIAILFMLAIIGELVCTAPTSSHTTYTSHVITGVITATIAPSDPTRASKGFSAGIIVGMVGAYVCFAALIVGFTWVARGMKTPQFVRSTSEYLREMKLPALWKRAHEAFRALWGTLQGLRLSRLLDALAVATADLGPSPHGGSEPVSGWAADAQDASGPYAMAEAGASPLVRAGATLGPPIEQVPAACAAQEGEKAAREEVLSPV